MGNNSSLEMPMSPEEIFKKYMCQSLGMPKASPSSSTKHQLFHRALYLYHFIYYVLFLACQLFLFSVQFSLLDVVLGWIPAILVLERDTLHFHARTLQFSLSFFCECSLLLVLRLALVFFVVRLLDCLQHPKILNLGILLVLLDCYQEYIALHHYNTLMFIMPHQ